MGIFETIDLNEAMDIAIGRGSQFGINNDRSYTELRVASTGAKVVQTLLDPCSTTMDSEFTNKTYYFAKETVEGRTGLDSAARIVDVICTMIWEETKRFKEDCATIAWRMPEGTISKFKAFVGAEDESRLAYTYFSDTLTSLAQAEETLRNLRSIMDTFIKREEENNA